MNTRYMELDEHEAAAVELARAYEYKLRALSNQEVAQVEKYQAAFGNWLDGGPVTAIEYLTKEEAALVAQHRAGHRHGVLIPTSFSESITGRPLSGNKPDSFRNAECAHEWRDRTTLEMRHRRLSCRYCGVNK